MKLIDGLTKYSSRLAKWSQKWHSIVKFQAWNFTVFKIIHLAEYTAAELRLHRDWSKKITHDQNLTIYKKSTIFELSSWNLVKKANSWVFYFDQHDTPKQIWIKSLVQCTRPLESSILIPKGSSNAGNGSYQLTCASQSANHGVMCYCSCC